MTKRFAYLVLGLICSLPTYANSTSNSSKPDLAEVCPAIPEKASGETFTFKLPHLKKTPASTRFANVWYDPNRPITATQTIVFYWHGTDGVTDEIDQAFGKSGVQDLVARGYIVVSPDHVRNAKGNGILKYSWYIANGSRLNYDIVLGDLIVECLKAKFKQPFAVITTGCSAGAMQSALWAFQNRDIVGMILYSGGIFRVPEFVPRPKFWAVITHGGSSDARGDFNFMKTAVFLHNRVLKLGHVSALCDFTPQGHDIHAEVAQILAQIIFEPENAALPAQCVKGKA